MADSETIPSLVRDASRLFSQSVAIETEAGETLSYRELAARVEVAARAFMAHGVQQGDRIAIWAPNVHEWVVAALGIHAAGGVLVPINTRYKAREAGYVLRNSEARFLCTVSGFLGTDYLELLQQEYGRAGDGRPVLGLRQLRGVIQLRGQHEDALSWETFLASADLVKAEEGRARADAVKPEDLSDLLYTSGTTGAPKGVMSTHGQNLRAFRAWADVVGLRGDDRYLLVNPFFHAFGYKAGILACLMSGCTALPHSVFDAGQVLERVERDGVTMLPGPPALYQGLLADKSRGARDLSSLRLAVTGAAVIPVSLIHQMKSELGFDVVITGYGLTECCGVVTMCRKDDAAETVAHTSGRAIPGVEVAVVDEQGVALPPGKPGEVRVRGYNVMTGYFNAPDKTAEVMDGGWFRTGDIGVLDAAGNLRITDRLKDMYIMGGFNCYPAEIEQLMAKNPIVAEVAVVGVPDERMGEVGKAFVVPEAGVAANADELVAWCREQMANFKVPRYVTLVDSLPRNALGKVTKHVLRDSSTAVAAQLGSPDS